MTGGYQDCGMRQIGRGGTRGFKVKNFQECLKEKAVSRSMKFRQRRGLEVIISDRNAPHPEEMKAAPGGLPTLTRQQRGLLHWEPGSSSRDL